MVWAKLSLDRLAVVPDRPYLGAAVVVLVADPAAAAVVVLVADDQALVVLVLVVIASHDLAAGCLFGHEVGLCANHRSLPSRMTGELGRPVGDWPVARITMRVCRRLPAPRSCPDAHRLPPSVPLDRDGGKATHSFGRVTITEPGSACVLPGLLHHCA